jgi:chemotaxis protein MotA
MLPIIGIVVVMGTVFGGYVAAGGKFGVILHALPYEMTMIGGAAVGAFLIGNSMTTVKQTAKDVGLAFKGARWKKEDYNDLLALLYSLTALSQSDPVALEAAIENPSESALFAKYPKIAADHRAVDMICDTLRASTMNLTDPHQVEDMLEKQLDADLHHTQMGSHALQNMADGLPALGIVAAVLGIIKTMSAIDKPPTVLGGMIGGALVGTFLGVFLAYGFVGPLSTRIASIVDEEQQFYRLIRDVLIANLHRHAPNMCVEVARQNAPHDLRPSFGDLNDALKTLRKEAA